MRDASIQLRTLSVNDRVLQENIARMSAATGRTVREETRSVFKSIVRDALAITPPASAGSQGKAAQRAGVAKIGRDLKSMGFAPVVLKGHRTITMAFGRPIAPVSVVTKENPKFADPDTFHQARLQAKHSGRVSRGGRQAFYVSTTKYKLMRTRLEREVGRLASGWIPAAAMLGIAVPGWISRHAGSARGGEVQILEAEGKLTMLVVNHFPSSAGAEHHEMVRRIETLKAYAIGRLKRQLPFVLKRSVRAAHH